MNASKIKVGQTYPYCSRTVPPEERARGKVEKVYKGATGTWVTLYDKARNKTVTVRPTQVGAQ